MHVTIFMVEISIKSVLAKQYPKQIRGMCRMIEYITMIIGGIIFPFYFEYLYNINPKMPFLGVTFMDAGTIVLSFVCFAAGFGKAIKNVADNDSNLSGSIVDQANEGEEIVKYEPVKEASEMK